MGGQCSCPIATESPSSLGGTYTPLVNCQNMNVCPTLYPVTTLSLTTPIYAGFYLMGVSQPNVAIDYNIVYPGDTRSFAFSFAFTKPPIVIITCDCTSAVVATVTGVTTTKFTIRLSSGVLSRPCSMRYLAIGTLATVTPTPVSYGTNNIFYLPAVLKSSVILDIGKVVSANTITPSVVTFFSQNPYQAMTSSILPVFSSSPLVFTNAEGTYGNYITTVNIGTTLWGFVIRYSGQCDIRYVAVGTTSLTNQLTTTLFGGSYYSVGITSMNMVMDYGSALGNEELSGSIDFNFAFAQPPIVLLTAANTINIGVSVKPGSIKTTGFSYVVSSMDGVSATIMYLAVGPIL